MAALDCRVIQVWTYAVNSAYIFSTLDRDALGPAQTGANDNTPS